MPKSAMQLLNEIETRITSLREVLAGDPKQWDATRLAFEYLRTFKDRPDGLDFSERQALAKRLGYDMRGTGGFFNGPGASLEWVNGGRTRARLTPSGDQWVDKLRQDHPDWF